jgi:hypothetical protein
MPDQRLALERESNIDALRRWKWTMRLARLGTVAATVLGVSIALNVGSVRWGLVIVEWCLGLPFSLGLAWHQALSPNEYLGAAPTWAWPHLALGASVIASWTLGGAAVDLIRHRRERMTGQGPQPPAGIGGAPDRYLRAAELEVERLLGGRLHDPIGEPRTEGNEDERPRRLLSILSSMEKATALTMGAVAFSP